jgi:protoporphyrinogen oxidase
MHWLPVLLCSIVIVLLYPSLLSSGPADVHVIVVGGGVSGLTAASTVLQKAGRMSDTTILGRVRAMLGVTVREPVVRLTIVEAAEVLGGRLACTVEVGGARGLCGHVDNLYNASSNPLASSMEQAGIPMHRSTSGSFLLSTKSTSWLARRMTRAVITADGVELRGSTDPWIQGVRQAIEEVRDADGTPLHRVVTGVRVTDVLDMGEYVRVLCADGTSLRGTHVILTVSVGVLRANLLSLQPPLSPTLRKQLGEVKMVAETKVFVAADAATDGTSWRWLAEAQAGTESVVNDVAVEAQEWLFARTIPWATPTNSSLTIFQFTFTDEAAVAIEEADHSEMVANLFRPLRRTAPAGTTYPDPVDYHVVRSHRDPRYAGAHCEVGYAYVDLEDVSPRILLAGEAGYGKAGQCFAHGAALAGRAAVRRIMHSVQ